MKEIISIKSLSITELSVGYVLSDSGKKFAQLNFIFRLAFV